MQNFIFSVVGVGMIVIVVWASLGAIDRITERDCARGIKSACQYVK